MRHIELNNPKLLKLLDGVSDKDIEKLLLSIFTIRSDVSSEDLIHETIRGIHDTLGMHHNSIRQGLLDIQEKNNKQTSIERLEDMVRGTSLELQRLYDVLGMQHSKLDNVVRQSILDLQEKGIAVKQTELPEGLLAPILGALTETRKWVMDSTSMLQNQDKVVLGVLSEKMAKVDTLTSNMEKIAGDLDKLVGRSQGSRKGVLLEDLVVDYLVSYMKDCNVERISSSKQKGRMDLCISRVGNPDIAVDLKNGSKAKNISSTDLEKFYRDMTTSGKHAILAVFNGCVTGKRRFHIEVHGKSVCVILHSLEVGVDYSQIIMAVNVIWILVAQLASQEVDGVVIGHTQMIEIQQNIDAFSELLKSQRTHLDLAIEANSTMARNRMLLSSLLKQQQQQDDKTLRSGRSLSSKV